VFDGNVHVKQKAQQTDAAQLSRNLLLSPKGGPNIWRQGKLGDKSQQI